MTDGGRATTCSDDVLVSVLMPPIHGRLRGELLLWIVRKIQATIGAKSNE